MLDDAYRQPYPCIDATGVLVLAKEKCRNAHFWVLVARRRCPVRSALDGAEHAAVAHHDPRRLSGCVLVVADGVKVRRLHVVTIGSPTSTDASAVTYIGGCS